MAKASKEKKQEKTNNNETCVEKGCTVSLDYEGKLESGEIFDSSKHGDHSHPLEFKSGSGMVIPGFDAAVLGMKINEEKEFSINPEDAYGMPNPQLKQEVPKSAIPTPEGVELKAGMTLAAQTPQGAIPVKISEVKKDTIVIDLNHPLAGKKLIFKIKILDIKK